VAPRCTICAHPQRGAIDKAIVSGEPERAIAGRFQLARATLQRHRPHTERLLAKTEVRQARTLAGVLNDCYQRVEEVYAKLDEAKGTPDEGGVDVLVALDSGLLDMKLKATREKARLAELEFGSKTTTTVVDIRTELGALSQAERRARIAEMKYRLIELESELAEGE
jgi:hypothetical protein